MEDKTEEWETATCDLVKEGAADILLGGQGSAFYNPAQEFNRDLTITVLRALSAEHSRNLQASTQRLLTPPDGDQPGRRNPSRGTLKPGLHILDALSASGLRGVRFAKEVQGVAKVVANDFSDTAVKLIEENVKRNGVEQLVECSHADANAVMFKHRVFGQRFHAIDLDPFGSPAHFLDAAVQAVHDDGILMVTCTDVAVLCGGHSPEACYAKYAAIPAARAGYCHEMGIRLALQSIDSHANRYGRYVEPLLSLSIDFYIRIFVRMKSGPNKVKDNVCKRSSVYVCSGCESFVLQPLITKQVSGKSVKYVQSHAPVAPDRCPNCQSHYRIAGPIWSGALFERSFIDSLLQRLEQTEPEHRLGTHDRLFGMLTVVTEELADVPLFYSLKRLCNVTKVPMPKQEVFLSAFMNSGHRVSVSHCAPLSIKTDAPPSFVWDVMRKLAENAGVKAEKHAETSPGYHILRQEQTHTIDLTVNVAANIDSKKRGLVRFQQNPGFGPKAKNKGSVISTQAGMYNASLGRSTRSNKIIAENVEKSPVNGEKTIAGKRPKLDDQPVK